MLMFVIMAGIAVIAWSVGITWLMWLMIVLLGINVFVALMLVLAKLLAA